MTKKMISQKKVDELFINMANDLHSKFTENVDIIYDKLFPEREIDGWSRFLYKNVSDRLIIEFGSVVSSEEENMIARREKKNAVDKSKKKATNSKRTVAK